VHLGPPSPGPHHLRRLYAAIPPLTPARCADRRLRRPPADRTTAPPFRPSRLPGGRPPRPSAARLTVLQPRASAVGLRRHSATSSTGYSRGRPITVGNDPGDHFLHRDGHRLVAMVSPAPGPRCSCLQRSPATEITRTCCRCSRGNHRTPRLAQMGRCGLILDENAPQIDRPIESAAGAIRSGRS